MLKIERRLIEWIEKHMLVLLLLLVSAIALYIRRIPIWWSTENITAYFDGHENSTQSSLFSLLMLLVQYLPLLPVHSIKWLSIAGDFGTALLCLLLVREQEKDNHLLQVFCYSLCLFSPVMFLRGCAWAQIDSPAVMLFLLGWLLWDKEKKIASEIFLLLSALLYPCMIVFVIWFIAKEKDWLNVLFLLALWLIFSGVMALPLRKSFPEGMLNCIAWLSYDPILGQSFATGLDWILEMATALGLAGSVIGCLVLVKKQKFPFFAVLVVHFLITVLYGSRMF